MGLWSRRHVGRLGLATSISAALPAFNACALQGERFVMPDPSYSQVWEGVPNVMAVDRAGRHLVLQSHREGGLIIVDLASRDVLHRLGSLSGRNASYGHGTGGSPLLISRDDNCAIWTEETARMVGDNRQVFVRRLDLASHATTVLAELTLRTGVAMQADTSQGLYLVAYEGTFLIEGGRAIPVAVDRVADLVIDQIVTNEGTTWLLGNVVGTGAVAMELTGATAGPLQRLEIAGGPSFSAVGAAGLWIMGGGTPGEEGRLYLLDPETLATRGDFSIETNGSGGPSAIAAGPHGAFIAAGDRLFRLTPQDPLPRLASPVSTTFIVDTATGLYGMTPSGVWRRDMSDLPFA